jgi:hypothetical protein
MFFQKISSDVRSGELVIDFVSVEVSQATDLGIKLEGHGVLKINEAGALSCDFICTKEENLVTGMFGARYPIDLEDPEQTLKLKAIDLQGRIWEGEHFTLEINKLGSPLPFKSNILLGEIIHRQRQIIPTQQENHLWFESLELSRIPKNKTNTINDTLAGQSFSSNQTDINFEDFKVSIIDSKHYTTTYANGVFDVKNLYEALKFYIGFTSGTMPNAYVMTARSGEDIIHHIRSINKKINKTSIPHPIEEHLLLEENKSNAPYHYQLLNNILYIQKEFPAFFNSTTSQWKRVWQGFNAQQSITALALTVSIEGLLIDLFIPKINQDKKDEDFEKQKKELIALLKESNINPEHLNVLVKSVERWGNIHENAALKVLAEKNLLTKDEVQAWKDLRNSSAHLLIQNQLK